MKLSDLNPGDVFRYEDGRIEYLSGTFMRMDENNSYIRPIAQKHRVFIIDMNTGVTHRHADYRKVIVISKSEDNMENKMGHFVDWKFGVPVKVFSKTEGEFPEIEYLIYENATCFRIMNAAGGTNWCVKNYYHYELIPYKYSTFSPRYPVCQTPKYTAFCNGSGVMAILDAAGRGILKPMSAATLIIDGKTIELSAETTAELKKKLEIV